MNELDVVRTAVMAYLGYGAVRLSKAPIDAAYEVAKQRSKQRLEWVIDNAGRKKKGKPVTVSDRVAFKAMTEAAFTDDQVTADYLGGVLAASSPDDDAAAPVIALIGRLSADQLRLHYVVYRELMRLWPADVPMNLYQEREANNAELRLPDVALVAGLGPRVKTTLGGSVKVLIREGLLGDVHESGLEAVDGQRTFTLHVRPTALGAEFFLWGRGASQVIANALFGGELVDDLGIPETPSVVLVNPPRAPTA